MPLPFSLGREIEIKNPLEVLGFDSDSLVRNGDFQKIRPRSLCC